MKGGDVSFLCKQEFRRFLPRKSPSPGLAFGQAGLSTARGEASGFIRLNSYHGFSREVWVPFAIGNILGTSE